MAHSCTMAHFQMATPNLFISLKITPQCSAGSKAWGSSFRSVACGPSGLMIFWLSARIFIVTLTTLTAAANASFFYSLISSHRSSSFKNWSNLMATCVTSIKNTTASSTSSNNTGEQQSSVSVWQDTWQQSTRWRKRSSNALKMFHSFTSDGESFAFFFYSYLCTYNISSYANWSTRFISAYHSGLFGLQAVWAN